MPSRSNWPRTPDRYVAGEESALVHWLNGGEAKPTFVPPRPFERGVGGRPTLVANVETLAHVALIARGGAEWWRSVGTAEDPGSALVTVSGAVARPGVYEIPSGAALEAVLGAAGAALASSGPVLVGGYFGTWIAADRIGQVESGRCAPCVGKEAASAAAPSPCFREGSCGLAESARVARWLADQNAGQCGPCVFGLPAIAAAMEAIVARGAKRPGRAARGPLDRHGQGPRGVQAPRRGGPLRREQPAYLRGRRGRAPPPGSVSVPAGHPSGAGQRRVAVSEQDRGQPDRLCGPRPLRRPVSRAHPPRRLGLSHRRSRHRSRPNWRSTPAAPWPPARPLRWSCARRNPGPGEP